MSDLAAVVTAAAGWIMTWWWHGLIIGACALLASRFVRCAAERELLWKFAIVVPLFTATFAMTGLAAPRAGMIHAADLARRTNPRRWGAPALDVEVNVDNGALHYTRRVVDPMGEQLAAALLLAFVMSGGLATLVFVCQRAALRRLVQSGSHVVSVDSRITIHESPGCVTPLTLGGRDVFVPSSFFALPREQRLAVLEHEAAHVHRRDASWFVIGELIAAIGVLQPLNRMLVRRLRRDAEFVCDEEAARRTGCGRELIAAFAHFATRHDLWARSTAAGFSSTSLIVERARAVLQLERATPAPIRRRALIVSMVVTLFILLAALPSVEARGDPGRGRRHAHAVVLTEDRVTVR